MASNGKQKLKGQWDQNFYIYSSWLWCCFYLLGSWQRSGTGKGDCIALAVTKSGKNCNILISTLRFVMVTKQEVLMIQEQKKNLNHVVLVTLIIHYVKVRSVLCTSQGNMIYLERHCLPPEKKLIALFQHLRGIAPTLPAPKSQDYVPYGNAPYRSLTEGQSKLDSV